MYKRRGIIAFEAKSQRQ